MIDCSSGGWPARRVLGPAGRRVAAALALVLGAILQTGLGMGASSASELERSLHRVFNEIRRGQGLRELAVDSDLERIARAHAEDMLRRHYFAHETPEGDSPGDRVARGHRRLIGLVEENLWSGGGYTNFDPVALARQIADRLMASPGHKENILGSDHNHTGIGAAVAGKQIRVVQLLASVQAYLESDLPDRILLGQSLNLAMTLVGASGPAVSYDLVERDSRVRLAEPAPISWAVPENWPAGERRLRFYFHSDKPGVLEIYPGPSASFD